jgi:hypothetical protein
MFGTDNNTNIISNTFMSQLIHHEGQAKRGLAKHVSHYWIALIATCLKLSRNCTFFPKTVFTKAETTLLSHSIKTLLKGY